MENNKYLRILILTGLLALPIALLLLPADFFDHGEALCPSKRFLDMECLGCGITRGVQHAIHLDFEVAWNYNKLTFIVLPIALFYWLHLFLLFGYKYHLINAIKAKLNWKKKD